jgi:ATP-dependent exoDNAse (exonuclease V) beta subunit
MPHISFSELRNWVQCPFYHKLTYVDRITEFEGNEFTAFGKAIHSTCEKLVEEKKNNGAKQYFSEQFEKELSDLINKNVDLKQDLVTSMEEQGAIIVDMILPAVDEYLGDYTVISSEELLKVPIGLEASEDYLFKGFVDLVVKTSDGKYHIIDWKTCGWGWDARKKAEPMVTYQLTLYKHYFAKKHNLDPKNIETHFALLKRTAKKNIVEIFRVTSGPKKTDNALKLLNKALYNISRKKYIKNRLSCGRCEFNNTKHCTR